MVGATVLTVAGLASAGLAVNAATLSVAPASSVGKAQSLLVPTATPSVVDDNGGLRPEDVSDDATATPAPVTTAEPGDDDLPQHSGQDDDEPDDHSGGDGSDD